MKKLSVLAVLSLLTLGRLVWAIPSSITYQGTLQEKGARITGSRTFTFELRSPDDNTPYSKSITKTLTVTNGTFSTVLDFELLPPYTWETITPYLRVYVENQRLFPTEPITATAYANVSRTVVDGAITKDKLADGSVTPSKLDSSIQNFLFGAGIVVPFAGPNPPAGWLLCDGSAVSRTVYANLFSAIGITWGGGNGTTTFNVPDLRGQAPIGAGQRTGLNNRLLGEHLGEENHMLTAGEMPAHNHGVNDPGHGHTFFTGSGFYLGKASDWNGDSTGSAGNSNNTQNNVTGISIQNTGGGASHNNMQPSAVVNYLIKI